MEKECALVAWWQRRDSERNKSAKKRRRERRGTEGAEGAEGTPGEGTLG